MTRILITGAAGKTGQAVIQQLKESRLHIRAFLARKEQQDMLRLLGAHETIVGDLRDPHVLSIAVTGIEKIYHICPNVHPGEYEIGKLIIDLAAENDVRHFIYHSVLHPQIKKMPHHWLKMRVEEYLFESGVPFTILQPCAYMQNILAQAQTIVDSGTYEVPYHLDAKLSLVDLFDVARAAARVLSEDKHEFATYELCGPAALDQNEIASTLSMQLRKPISAKEIALPDWRTRARSSGLSDYQVDTLDAMFDYYGKHGFSGNPGILAMLLGEAPTSLKTCLAREVGIFQAFH